MADTPLVFNKKNSAADNIESFFVSPGDADGTKIKVFTASNGTTSGKSYLAYIYDSGGDAVDPIIPQTIVVRDTSDHGTSIVDQVIPAGGSLRISSSDAESINFYVTGSAQ